MEFKWFGQIGESLRLSRIQAGNSMGQPNWNNSMWHRESGVSAETIQNYIQGKTTPRVDKLLKLASALGFTFFRAVFQLQIKTDKKRAVWSHSSFEIELATANKAGFKSNDENEVLDGVLEKEIAFQVFADFLDEHADEIAKRIQIRKQEARREVEAEFASLGGGLSMDDILTKDDNPIRV